MPDAPDSSGSILFDFADQLLSDVESGRLRPLAHYLARFPGHEEKVAREYIALTSELPEAEVRARTRDRGQERIGPYKIVGILGRGGQGIVYRAQDPRLDRSVALKVLTIPIASVSQGRRARFRREAEILARLDHPGICAVLDADLDAEAPYIAMRYVEGETLAAALARLREASETAITPDSPCDNSTSAYRLLVPRRALELAETLSFFERAARALHAAHEAGVVHRDVKPGNLMVSTEGSPVILDFGLARDDGEDAAQLTRSDEVFGTPAYISPEQLESGRHVDRATDVYSLGVVLYECLTLARPYQGDSNAALALAIRSAPLPSARTLNTHLPHDLEVVLETALERDVARRYPTALEFAEELRRVREYEPILARPAGPLLRLRRFGQRSPVLATGIVGSIVVLSVALSISLVLLGRVRTEQQRKETALALYEGGWFRDEASSALPNAPPRALNFAIAAAEHDPGLASNRMLLAALEALQERALLTGHRDVVYAVDIDPASKRIASASLDGTVRIWDAVDGRELAVFDLGAPVHAVRFSRDGARLTYAGSKGHVVLRSLVDPDARVVELVGHTHDVHSVEFSPDGTHVLTASRDRTARLFDSATGRQSVVYEGHSGSVAEARFAHAGSWVLTRSAEPRIGSQTLESDGTKRIFAADTGREIVSLTGSPGTATAIDVSPDGRWLAAACDDRNVQVWDLAAISDADAPRVDVPPSLEPARTFTVGGRCHAARFSPDSRSLALSWDAGAKVVDVHTGADRYVLPSHGHRAIVRVEWRPDGLELATAAYDDALRIFRAEDGQLVRTCRGSVRQIIGMAWSPDGSFLTTWQRQNSVSVWYGEVRPFLPVLRGHSGPVRTARFITEGRRALTASHDGCARTWEVPSGKPELVFDAAGAELSRDPLLGATSDTLGQRIVTTDVNGRVLVWDGRDAQLERRIETGSATGLIAVCSPDGARIALADGPGGVRVLDLATSAERHFEAHAGELTAMRFSPDGRRLATGGSDRTVCLWDVSGDSEPGREHLWRTAPYEAALRNLTHVFDVAFSPDGRHVAAAEQGTRVEVFDESGRCVAHTAQLATQGRIAFAPEQGLLVGAAKYGRGTSMWRFPGVEVPAELENLSVVGLPGEHHANSVTGLAIARDAPWAVTGSLDRTAQLWNLDIRRGAATFSGHVDAVYDVDIDASGTWILTGSADSTARLWPRDILSEARRARPAGYTTLVGAVADSIVPR